MVFVGAWIDRKSVSLDTVLVWFLSPMGFVVR
jgi:nucleoside permease NupC